MCNKNVVSILVSAILFSGSVYADINKTSVDLGYKFYTSDTKDDNPGVFNQPFVKLNHLGIADWGTYFANLKLENPAEIAENQKHVDGKTTIKSLLILENKLGESQFNFDSELYLCE